MRLSALDLQNTLVLSAPSYLPPPPGAGAMLAPYGSPKPYDPDDDVIRRLTQVICLHWHVWADLVYLAPRKPMFNMTNFSQGRSLPRPGSASPTMPIAQAVYAPGKKWLPVGVTLTEIPGMPESNASPKAMNKHAEPKDIVRDAHKFDNGLTLSGGEAVEEPVREGVMGRQQKGSIVTESSEMQSDPKQEQGSLDAP